MVETAGGKVEAMYYTFGKDDVAVIADLPDNAAAASLWLAVPSTGLVRLRTTPLLTIEEADQASGKSVTYRAPGQ